MRTEYVSLILVRDGKVLVEKRKASKRLHPGAIVFPAGKIEPGETKEEAIVREMKEELGIIIHNPTLVFEADFDIGEKQKIYWFTCESFSGSISCNEAEEIMWIEDFSLLTYSISRTALEHYKKLCAKARRNGTRPCNRYIGT